MPNVFDEEDPFRNIDPAEFEEESAPPRRRRSKRRNDKGTKLIMEVATWLAQEGYSVTPSSGIWRTPEALPVRSKSIGKRALVRKLWMREAIPEGLDQRQEVLIAVMEELAEKAHATAWEDLDRKVNKYVPWPDGYNPFMKFIRAIGDSRLFTDENGEQALDKECGMRHIWWQMKQVIAGKANKDAFPLAFLAHGPGESGKSRIIQLALSPLEDFAFNDTFSLITDPFKQKRANQSPAIFLDEMERADRTTAAAFKNFITSKTIMARAMYTDEVPEDENINTTFMATNEEAPFGFYDTSSGFARRILLFPCSQIKFVDREEEVKSFTYADALAMFQGIQLDSPPPIMERKERITESQRVLISPTFERRWLDSQAIKLAQPYNDVPRELQRLRRLHFDEVQESMRLFKAMEGTHERLVHGLTLKRRLQFAGAETRSDKRNNHFLVSHRLRTEQDRALLDDDELE